MWWLEPPAGSRRGRALPSALRDLERRPRQQRAQLVLLRALALLDRAAPGPAPRLSPAAWLNNTRTHEELLALLDLAIALAETQ